MRRAIGGGTDPFLKTHQMKSSLGSRRALGTAYAVVARVALSRYTYELCGVSNVRESQDYRHLTKAIGILIPAR